MFKTLKSKIIVTILTILIALSAFTLTADASFISFNGDGQLAGGSVVSGDPSGNVSWYSPGAARTGWVISIVDTNGSNKYAPYIYVDMGSLVQKVKLKNYDGTEYEEYINYGQLKSKLGGRFKFEASMDEYGYMMEEAYQESAIIWAEGNCPWPAPFINSTHGSNVSAVRDWMQRKDKIINGTEVTNAHWVIYKYFGSDI